MLSETEENSLKKWLEWQKEASLTNTISVQMEQRQEALKTELGRPLTDTDLTTDLAWSALKVQHDNQASKCELPFKDFKEIVKGVE